MQPLAYCFVGLCVLQLTVIGVLGKLFISYVSRSEIRSVAEHERARLERHALEIKLIAMLDPTAAQVAMQETAFGIRAVEETDVRYVDEDKELELQRSGGGVHA